MFVTSVSVYLKKFQGHRNRTHGRHHHHRTHGDRNDYEELLNLAELLGDVKEKGLSAEQASRLPTRKYKDRQKKDDGEECMICMCEYEGEDVLRILPCFHEFHSTCIDKWIKVWSKYCSTVYNQL